MVRGHISMPGGHISEPKPGDIQVVMLHDEELRAAAKKLSSHLKAGGGICCYPSRAKVQGSY